MSATAKGKEDTSAMIRSSYSIRLRRALFAYHKAAYKQYQRAMRSASMDTIEGESRLQAGNAPKLCKVYDTSKSDQTAYKSREPP